MPLGPTDLFWIGMVPAVIAALAMWLSGRAGIRTTAAWAVSIAGGVFFGMIAQNLRVSPQSAIEKLLHPRVALDWLPWLVLLAASITILAAYAPRTWQRWIVALACIVAVAVPMRLWASNAAAMTRWSPAEKLGVLLFWSIAFAAWWLTLAVGRRNGQPLLRSGLLLAVAFGIALTLAASGSITLGEISGVAAATLAGAIGIAWAIGLLADGPSPAAGPLAVVFGGLILLGYSYNLTAVNATLLAISLAASAGWLPFLPLPPGEGRGEADLKLSWTPMVLRAALTLIPLAIAAASAVATATSNLYG